MGQQVGGVPGGQQNCQVTRHDLETVNWFVLQISGQVIGFQVQGVGDDTQSSARTEGAKHGGIAQIGGNGCRIS